MLVCARIEHNPHNNDYVAEQICAYPDRLVQFADVDCSWSAEYHTPGAAERLKAASAKYQLKGYTHYVKSDTEWFASEEGLAFFSATADLNLIASLALGPQWQPALRELARRFPSVTFLCHHMAGANAREEAPHPNLQEILRSAEVPNIYIKLSGFHYASHVSWGVPLFGYAPHRAPALRTLWSPASVLGFGLPGSASQHDLPARARSIPHALHVRTRRAQAFDLGPELGRFTRQIRHLTADDYATVCI